MRNAKAINVGIIGTGGMGRYHAALLSGVIAGSSVVAVAGSDAGRTEQFAARLGGVATVRPTGEDLIHDERVHAVVVATSGDRHEEFVVSAIQAGKPVFCEKPLAATSAACLRIVEAEVAHGKRLLQVGFMRRFDPAYRALKTIVAGGTISTPLFFHSVHRNPAVPDQFTHDMTFRDVCVHDIDVARWLLDDEVAAISVVWPRRNSRGRPNLRDPVFVLMEMERGALVDVEISVNIGYGYDIRGEISGETGVAGLPENNPVFVKSDGAFRGTIPMDWFVRFQNAFEDELREWLGAAAKGMAAGPSAWDGYMATVVAEAALEASESGKRTPVPVQEHPELYASKL
jgi:myo-inositol 2-dehydrogenase/D-chiro-inositol 1-dehydrogenase